MAVENPYGCKAFCTTRQRVKRPPPPSATETSSSSVGSTSSRPATIVSAAAPPASFGFRLRKSSSTRPAARRWKLSVGPPSQSTERTPCSSRRRAISSGRSSPTRAYSTWSPRPCRVASEPVAITTRCSGSFRSGRSAGRSSLALTLVAQLVGLGHAPVALDADRAGAHHDGVGLGAEVVEELPVELGREAPRAPVDGRLAVEAGDHVEREIRALRARLLGHAQTRGELGRGGGSAVWIEELQGRELRAPPDRRC